MGKWNTMEAERSLLCAILAKPGFLDTAAAEVGTADFCDPQASRVFGACLSLWEDGTEIDTANLTEALVLAGMEARKASVLVRELAHFDLDFSNPDDYAKRIREASRERAVRSKMAELIKDDRPADALLADLDALLADAVIGETAVSASEIALAAMERGEQAYKNRIEGKPQGVTFGLIDLDKRLGAIGPGELCVIGGTTSAGKSSLMLAGAAHMARSGFRVGFVSLEDAMSVTGPRLVAREGRVDLSHFNTGAFEQNDFKRLGGAADRLSKWPIWFYFDGNLTAGDVCRRMRSLKVQHKVDVIFVDYLQEVQGTGDNRHAMLSSATTAIKATAKKMDVPVIVGSQLVKDADGRRPTKGDLKESGDIANKSDRILLMWNREDEGMWVRVAKNKNGPTGDVRVSFVGEYASIENFAERYDAR